MIGVFGGTFDPVHYGHLRPLLEVRQALALDEVRLIPCRIPPHREAPGATAEQRLAMLEVAVAGVPGFRVDTLELEREGPSYMVDTLAQLRDEVGDKPLCLILGQDAFAGLESWHEWRRLVELAHIVVTRRPGSDFPRSGELGAMVEQRRAAGADMLRERPAGLIWFQEVTQLDISATSIRESLRQGRDVRFLMPEPVRIYIEAQGLYS